MNIKCVYDMTSEELVDELVRMSNYRSAILHEVRNSIRIKTTLRDLLIVLRYNLVLNDVATKEN